MNNPDDKRNAALTLPPPRRSWFTPSNQPDNQNRVDGLSDFIRALRAAPPTERERCVLDPCYAKQKFAEWGGFYVEGQDPQWNSRAIPASTVFRMYDSEPSTVPPRHRKKRDEQVVLVLDNQEDLATTGTWRCTYSPYAGS